MQRIMLAALAVLWMCAAVPAVDAFGLVTTEDLIGHRFILSSINGAAPSGEREVFFQVDDKMMIAGRVCNVFRGQGDIQGGDLLVMKTPVSSRMACPDADLGQLENRLFRLLNMGMIMTMQGERLTLRRDDLILVFDRSYGMYAMDGAPGAAVEPPASAPAPEAKAAVAADDLVGRKFVLASIAGEPFAGEGVHPFIAFEDGMRVVGATCNNFTGPGELKDGKLFVKNAAATMKMCVDDKLNKLERDFHKMVREGAAIALEGDTLTLSSGDIVLVYTLEKPAP